MNNLAIAFAEKELVESIASHLTEDTHSIVLINDLGSLNFITSCCEEDIAKLRTAVEQKIIAKKEELYETLSSFLPSVSPQTRELTIQNLQGVFEKINESRFFDLAK